MSLKYLKNYQIWYKNPLCAQTDQVSKENADPLPSYRHHRQVIMTKISTIPPTELSFLAQMFEKDYKNYHVWSYRQWLVRHFSLWDTELPYIETLLDEDVRNNSAWNHRWFVVFSRYVDPSTGTGADAAAIKADPLIAARETDYAKAKIRLAPQNESPWNYLRGVVRKREGGLAVLTGFAEEFADLGREDQVRSSHALDLLADVYAAGKEKERAGKALELLARKYDPIRKNYWNYRRGLLGLRAVEA